MLINKVEKAPISEELILPLTVHKIVSAKVLKDEGENTKDSVGLRSKSNIQWKSISNHSTLSLNLNSKRTTEVSINDKNKEDDCEKKITLKLEILRRSSYIKPKWII